MKIKRFEDALVWQKAEEVTLQLYKLFKTQRDFEFRSQILSASLSIMNNIAEGLDRGTDKELIRFLYIAKASCAEVRSMLHLARKLEYIDDATCTQLYDDTVHISRMLASFIRKLQTS